MKIKPVVLWILLSTALAAWGESAQITIDTAHPSHKVSPTLWGIFFEDINLSADGGVYPELVRNRSFEDSDKPEFWTLANNADGHCEMAVATADYTSRPAVPPLNPFNRKSLRVKVDGGATIENEGYWGMNIVKGESYTLKLAARAVDGYSGPITVKLVTASGIPLATGQVSGFNGTWKYYTVDLTPIGSDPKGRLQLSLSGKGTVYLDMVSLMPKKLWKKSGLREDLAESIDALHPSFLRFPGGCWVEGDDFEHMYHWKNTIGDIDARTPLWNIWGYNATHGLGFHEYLQMAEDLGAEPLFCINVGMSHKEVVPMSKMGQWVQDALDAIEYANGDTNSYWGAVRAKAGHPAPFNLKYMEIGNENGGDSYGERWPLFYKAIKAKYPYMHLVADNWQGGYPHKPMPDIVDEHFYDSPEWFMRHATHFDNYDRKGPKIFVGEYAVTKNTGKGNLRGALGEAAFMTGLERNSDVVVMASYAPLFVNLNHRAWNPDLINYDSSRWYGLPSYFVQKLFSENRGTEVLPTAVQTGEVETKPTGAIGVGTWNTEAEFKDVKVTAPDGKVLLDSNQKTDWKFLGDGAQWSATNGVLRQTAEREFIRAIAGNKSWTDYTLQLKARKITGKEGFLVLFHIADDDDRNWWNLGGWENSQHAVEFGETLDGQKGSIDADHWYDIKIQLAGDNVKCWLDGKVIHDIKLASMTTRTVFASATRDEAAGDLIIKVVNTAATPTDTEIMLNGAKKLSGRAQAIVLTSDSPRDENSIDEPTKVSPKTETFNVSGTTIRRSLPGNSFTVLRVSMKR